MEPDDDHITDAWLFELRRLRYAGYDDDAVIGDHRAAAIADR